MYYSYIIKLCIYLDRLYMHITHERVDGLILQIDESIDAHVAIGL
jgi:hypothetical protein